MKLQPPDTSPPETSRRPSRGLVYLIAGFCLINGLLLLLWMHHLKGSSTKRSVTSPTLQEKVDAPPPPEQPPENQNDSVAQGHLEAEQALKNWLEIQAKAELLSVRLWAKTDYNRALDLAGTGDEAYGRRQYPEASAAYEQATEIFAQTIADKDRILADLLRNGEAALLNGQPGEASEAFSRALVIEPNNTTAREGKQRAESAVKVSVLVEQADSLIKDGEWEAAQEPVRRALKLDPANSRAEDLLGSIDAQLNQQAFQLAMSDFFTERKRKKYSEAEEALERARQLKPQSKIVADAANELKAERRAEKVRKMKKIYAQEALAENWSAAADIIEKTLDLDKQAAFAVQNRETVARRIQVDQRLSRLLKDPLTLRDESHYKAAASLLEYAKTLAPGGPRLTAQIQELTILLLLARQKVKVRLFSDNQTIITVYKVGKLGAFRSLETELIPGRYTVIGQRAGFRDVRKTLTVPIDGTSSLTMTIVCEEKI